MRPCFGIRSDSVQIKINGRTHMFNRVRSLKKVAPAKWEAVATHGTYLIEGGKKAGGSRRDWFLDGSDETALRGTIRCTSLTDALSLLLENC